MGHWTGVKLIKLQMTFGKEEVTNDIYGF